MADARVSISSICPLIHIQLEKLLGLTAVSTANSPKSAKLLPHPSEDHGSIHISAYPRQRRPS
jgi:hypothetical protein